MYVYKWHVCIGSQPTLISNKFSIIPCQQGEGGREGGREGPAPFENKGLYNCA